MAGAGTSHVDMLGISSVGYNTAGNPSWFNYHPTLGAADAAANGWQLEWISF